MASRALVKLSCAIRRWSAVGVGVPIELAGRVAMGGAFLHPAAPGRGQRTISSRVLRHWYENSVTTEIVSVDPNNPNPRAIARAAEFLRAGRLVAFPTETVYGLGADALNANAVRAIFWAKGRPSSNPLIVHVP